MAEYESQVDLGANQAQPGQVVTPGGAGGQESSGPPVAAEQPEQQPDPAPDQAAIAAEPVSDQTEPATNNQSFVPAEPENPVMPRAGDKDVGVISWTGSEFVEHHKSAGWYGLLALAAIVLGGLIYLLTRDLISTAVVVAGLAVLGAYGARKPRQLDYRVDNGGVTIGQKYHVYDEFRSFALAPEGQAASIVFMPLKRFAPLTTIYYDAADEEKIVSLLSNYLPVAEYNHDPVDRLMHRIHF